MCVLSVYITQTACSFANYVHTKTGLNTAGSFANWKLCKSFIISRDEGDIRDQAEQYSHTHVRVYLHSCIIIGKKGSP